MLLASVITLTGFGIPQVANGGSSQTRVRYSVLHSFQGVESSPVGPLTSDGRGNLYGATARGGPSDGGTVFMIRTDGTGYQRLHTFTGGAGDGFRPQASLVLDGAGNLYGTTMNGGLADSGTVFTIKEDGSGFAVVHSFGGGAGDGGQPSNLTLDAQGNLYGTTTASSGTIFRLRTDGTGFQRLHTFAGGLGDGRGPGGCLLLDGSGTLFGTTAFGGQSPVYYPKEGFFYDGFGTLFSIKTDGTGFRILRAFPVDVIDGACPSGSVITDEAGYLYGLNGCGGSSDYGTAYRIGKDGSGFEILHSFSGSDDKAPSGSLVLDRSGYLHGLLWGGMFRMKTDGTEYLVTRTFLGSLEGSSPSGLLLLDESETLFATMASGGASGWGTIFSVETDGSAFQVLHAFAGLAGGASPISSLVADGSGYLFGTTLSGGASYAGTVVRIRSDGTGFQVLHTFGEGGLNDGAQPLAGLVLDRAGNLYGTSSSGGPSGLGTVFRLKTDGSGFQLLHVFQGGSVDGLYPVAALALDTSGSLYGTTVHGGPSNAGTIFRIRTDGSGFQLLHTFTYGVANDGAEPYAPLTLDGSGNLFGTTTAQDGSFGPSDRGTVFTLRTDGTGFRLLRVFVSGANYWLNPSDCLINDGSGNLYGTAGGGASGEGIIFQMKADGTSFQALHTFVPVNEGSSGVVILDGLGNLYGTTQFGGAFEAGTVFSLKTDGTGLRILHAFGGETGDGKYPRASVFLDGSGRLFGTTENGGSADFGTVFGLSLNPPITTSGPFVPVRKR